MGKQDPRVDAYIAKSAEFARPILEHLRKIVHEGCPECEETMKWSFPHFDYKGMFCSMAAFKEHCAFGFWKQNKLVLEKDGISDEAMGQFGRISKVADLPSKKILVGYVKKAVKLNDDGVKLDRPKPAPKADFVVPDDLKISLAKNAKAGEFFEKFPPGQKREYVEWITEAKAAATRERRLAQAVEWIAEGKSRNWKYKNC